MIDKQRFNHRRYFHLVALLELKNLPMKTKSMQESRQSFHDQQDSNSQN